MSELNGMSVVVTRAAHQAEELCQIIETAGGRAIRFPVTRIEPVVLNEAQVASVSRYLASVGLVIFTSPNAAVFGIELLRSKELSLPSHCACLAIGPGTHNKLLELGVKVGAVPQGRYDSEGLLALPELSCVNHRQILIIRGEEGLETLRNELTIRGARVLNLNCYRRLVASGHDPNLVEQWTSGGFDAVILLSTTAIKHLKIILGDRFKSSLKAAHLIVPSERVGRCLQEFGLQDNVHIARSAEFFDLLERLSALAKC